MDEVPQEKPDHPLRVPVRGSRPPAPQRPWFAIAAVLFVIFGIASLLLPSEIARWYEAAAEEAALDQDHERAIRRISQALRWRPDDPRLLVRRAELRSKSNDLEGSLEDCNQAWELAEGGRRMAVLEQRMAVFQRRGQHEQALADADRIVEMVEAAPNQEVDRGNGQLVTLPLALNNRAYACALANRNLDGGLADIERALSLLGVENDAALLDTRGYLNYLLGNLAAALSDMERAVQLAESDRRNFQAIRADQLRRGMDPRVLEQIQELSDQNLAVLYHHRGLIYQQLGQEAEAQQDLVQAEKLGYDPETGVW